MTVFIATLLTFLIAFFALSVGMIFGDIKIKGHCGSPSLDDGCCETDSQYQAQSLEHQGNCSIDENGNKINQCDTCSCDS